VLRGMVLRARPRPVGVNSAVQGSPSTLDITKARLCPSATTWSPCFGMRFFRLAMSTFSHGPDPMTTPCGFQTSLPPEVWDLTASSAVNLPTISARLRLVVKYVPGSAASHWSEKSTPKNGVQRFLPDAPRCGRRAHKSAAGKTTGRKLTEH